MPASAPRGPLAAGEDYLFARLHLAAPDATLEFGTADTDTELRQVIEDDGTPTLVVVTRKTPRSSMATWLRLANQMTAVFKVPTLLNDLRSKPNRLVLQDVAHEWRTVHVKAVANHFDALLREASDTLAFLTFHSNRMHDDALVPTDYLAPIKDWAAWQTDCARQVEAAVSREVLDVLQVAKATSPASQVADEGAGADAKLLASSQARRAELLALPWWTAEQVGQALGSEAPSNPSQAASRLRAARSLLGVWDGRRFMHPDFQFQDGHLTPRLDELLAVLPADDRNGWRRAIWLYAPNRRLKDRAPADVWRENPDAVIEAAREAYAAPLVDF